ncbi:hypothetical protein Tco_1422202, partial [Tanacetum coccineum]
GGKGSVNGGDDENLDVSRNENEEWINGNGKVNAGSNTDSIGKDNDTSKNVVENEVMQEFLKSTKWVKVEYSWKPNRCGHCGVFGHNINNCKTKPKSNTDVEKEGNKKQNGRNGSEEFVEVRYKKNIMTNQSQFNQRNKGNHRPIRKEQFNENVKYAYQPKDKGIKQNVNAKKIVQFLSLANLVVILVRHGKLARKMQMSLKGVLIRMQFYDMMRMVVKWKAIERKDAMGVDDSSEEEYLYVNQNGAIRDLTAN